VTPVDWWSHATKKLVKAGFGRHDARYILEDTLGFSIVQIISNDLDFLPEKRVLADERMERRLRGEPLAYILGWKEFYGRRFIVDRRVLIPRPETELLAEAVIAIAQPGWQCADIGTGSGCLGITIEVETRNTSWICADVSLNAIALAQENARRLTARCHFVHADMLSAFGKETFDLVVSNPPYVAEGDDRLAKDVRDWEPREALLAGESGTTAIERLIDGAARALRPRGMLAFEFGIDQSESVAELLDGWSPRIERDLAGIDRYVIAVRP
jgi:release factor glutamine methyltransferase